MDDLISRQAALDALRTCYDTETVTMDNGDEYINYNDAVGEIEQLPPAQFDTNLAEEYARAVRNWLVNYQVKCADLAGRYTPYEVLGWIVSDWRKENGIL